MVNAGLVKMAKLHFENCKNNAEEKHYQGDYSTFCVPRHSWGPNAKKKEKKENEKNRSTVLHGYLYELSI